MIGNGSGFGVSFLPNGDQRYARNDPGASPLGGGQGRAPIQDAVQILSMRIPRVLGGAPITPYALLSQGGSAGLQAGQLNQLMRTLGLDASALQATTPGGPAGPTMLGAPSPFAAQSSMTPMGATGPLGVGISAATEGPASGGTGGTMPPPATPPIETSGPSLPGDPGQDSQALWEEARRQREAMGRIAY